MYWLKTVATENEQENCRFWGNSGKQQTLKLMWCHVASVT